MLLELIVEHVLSSASTAICSSILSESSGGSPYHTIPPADVIADGWVLPMLRTTRSTSLDNLRVEELIQTVPQRSSATALYEYYKLAYAETLHRWGLLYNRAEK
ncbi:hypothetical protein NQ317_018768 [Molorchus minor]|uniref:Uncharacterized protein n=1 Tax=Molorchus minor TaxID=1323400 RepID=A0ABQ9J5U9_9CUCU|nr:hypothetical protein NQ317_018768 [Molorchus minor]